AGNAAVTRAFTERAGCRLADDERGQVEEGGGGSMQRVGDISGDAFVADRSSPAPPITATGDEVTDVGAEGVRGWHGASGHREEGAVAPRVRIEDATRSQVPLIVSAVIRARKLLDNALAEVAAPVSLDHASALNLNF